MDVRVSALTTPEDCEAFARNCAERGRLDLAQQARARAVELRALTHGATTDAEREALAAVYAYEEILSQRRGKKTRASRTWQMIKRHGVLQAVERAVNRPEETAAYTALVEMGLQDYAFEAIVVKYPALFSAEAVTRCKARIAQWSNAK